MVQQRKISFANSNNPAITMSAVVVVPDDFEPGRRHPAIVVTHPGGGVKEQTAGTYATRMASAGFVTIAYDASYQGESGGTPRQLENPHVRTEDVSCVVDHLLTLDFVDPGRIGALGICAGAGYTANAAINDPRIKAVGAVSAVNIGAMFRNGWANDASIEAAVAALEEAAAARSSEASGEALVTVPLVPMTEADASNEEMRQVWEYYHTPRGQQPTAPGLMAARSFSQILPYDAFNMAEVYLRQPLRVIVGSHAGSKWMSDDLYSRAASVDKQLHVVKGANHMDLFDREHYLEEVLAVLGPFFQGTLAARDQ